MIRPIAPAEPVASLAPPAPTPMQPQSSPLANRVTLSGEAAAAGGMPGPVAQSLMAMSTDTRLQQEAQRIEQVQAAGGNPSMLQRQLRQDYAEAQQQGPVSDATQAMVQQALGQQKDQAPSAPPPAPSGGGGAPSSGGSGGGGEAPASGGSSGGGAAPASGGSSGGGSAPMGGSAGGGSVPTGGSAGGGSAPTGGSAGGGTPTDTDNNDGGGGTTPDTDNGGGGDNNNVDNNSDGDSDSSDGLVHDIHSQAFEDRMHNEVGDWEDDFRQGGQGNCASVAPIKAAMDYKAFGDEVFSDVQQNNDGYDVTLRDGSNVHLSNGELDAAYQNSGFVGQGDGYDYANFMYGVMAKHCSDMRGYGSIQGGFNELNNGNMFENTTNYLGIENYCEQVDPSVASEYGPAMLCSNVHAVFADINDEGQHIIDLWGNYLNDNGTDGIGDRIMNAYAIVL